MFPESNVILPYYYTVVTTGPPSGTFADHTDDAADLTNAGAPRNPGIPPLEGPSGTTAPARVGYLAAQIFQITPVPGIWTSGPSPAVMNFAAGSDWPKSRTAP